MKTYTETEKSGQQVTHISFMADPFFFSLMTNENPDLRKCDKKKGKPVKTTPQMSNFRKYHQLLNVGTPKA